MAKRGERIGSEGGRKRKQGYDTPILPALEDFNFTPDMSKRCHILATYGIIEAKNRRSDMGKKTAKYKREGIKQLSNNMPVRYDILNRRGKPNYHGSAGRGNVRSTIAGHLGKIPGTTVKIHQHHRIREARKEEANAIKRNKPPYNKLGK